MSPPEHLRGLLAEGRTLRRVGDGIYSALPHDAARRHLYDRRAAVYDLLVSTRVYNRLMWGTSPHDYEAFAREASDSAADGPLLDAACGSMLFTARVHAPAGRQVVAFDQSLRMLERARERLVRLAGRVPADVALVQADLDDIPFRPGSFAAVLCMNALHQYDDAEGLLPRLESMLAAGGRLFVNSLVKTGRTIGDRYLGALHRAGEFTRPRSAAELTDILKRTLTRPSQCRTRGNMLYAVTDDNRR
jgi:ubiquinone/menaquinone biosynthesis C-methylase UbiE